MTSSAFAHASSASIPLAVIDHAQQVALRSCASSGVRVRLLTSLADTSAAQRLMSAVWGSHPGAAPVSIATMRALEHAGHYVAGAFLPQSDELVGCAIGFFSGPPVASMHSHVAAVSNAHAGRGIGVALKLHQRAWCLERGVTHMNWTFDPLIARNAHVNLSKLGAEPVEYLPDFYGPMDDARNRGVASDRLLVRWNLLEPLRSAAGTPSGVLVEAKAGEPVRRVGAPDPTASVAIPADIERMRADDAPRAERWQLAVRAALVPALHRGARVGFEVERGYIITEQEHHS